MTGDNSDTGTGIGAIGRMQGVVRCERASHLYLCTLERQSLCESHRQRRWLTHWSYLHYKQHASMAVSLFAPGLKDDFEAHATLELQHADVLAQRIQQ